MKKSLIILLILVITAVAGAGWAAADVNKAKDQIEIEEDKYRSLNTIEELINYIESLKGQR